jgi:DNA sulfur modification protein DndD
MIFQELVLENFGPYQGRQTIHLAPSETQPIVLFGGMNGGGKTTLMDALRLALYEQRALCSTRGNLSYGEFLNQCTNRHTTEPTQIELTFQHTLNNTPTVFRICRTWTRQPKQGRDILRVCKDGREDAALTKAWDEQIENLFPLGISSLFLFDGEQVKELAEASAPQGGQDELPAIVVTAICALLGLELPDRLSADLEVLVTRKHKELAQQQELQHLERIEQTLKTQEDSRRRIKKQVAAIQPKLDAAVEQLRLAEAKFLSDGGRIAAERSQLEAELQQATIDAETGSVQYFVSGANLLG